VQWLDLDGHGIGADGAAMFGPHLAALSSLQSLDLHDNYTGTVGAAVLAPNLAELFSRLQ
jgi:hypothetical protein